MFASSYGYVYDIYIYMYTCFSVYISIIRFFDFTYDASFKRLMMHHDVG